MPYLLQSAVICVVATLPVKDLKREHIITMREVEWSGSPKKAEALTIPTKEWSTAILNHVVLHGYVTHRESSC